MATGVTPELGQLVAAGFEPSTAVATGFIAYRVVIPGVGSAFVPGDPDPLPDTDFFITSRRRSNHPWIAQRGEGPEATADIAVGGQRLDPNIGHAVDGELQIRLIDVATPVQAVACNRNDPLIVEGDYGLDSTAFGAGGWTRRTDQTPETDAPYSWWQVAGDPFIAGFTLFGWADPGTFVRSGWIEKTFNGTEGGGPAWTPGQIVGFHFRANWTLDSGPGNIFAEANGDRVSFPNGSYDFWTIDQSLASNISDNVLYATVDGAGEVLIKLGAENLAPSNNINCSFTALEFVSCEPVVAAGDDLYITSWLADTAARQQLLGRRAFLEQSLDGGATWSSVVYAGFVKQLTLDLSLTYLLTLGDSGRGRRVSRAWSQISPVADFIP